MLHDNTTFHTAMPVCCLSAHSRSEWASHADCSLQSVSQNPSKCDVNMLLLSCHDSVSGQQCLPVSSNLHEAALWQLVEHCMTCDLGCRVTGNAEAAVEADASVARLILCTVNYCWRDIPAHVSSTLLVSCSLKLLGKHAYHSASDLC